MVFVPDRVAIETELTATDAFDVIATDVFLHMLLASRTLTRELLYPQLIVPLLISKLTPFLHLKTRRRLMRLFLTLETVHSATGTLNVILLHNRGFFTKQVA